ncbi:hypothetical protein FACS189432_03400 [Bacteroidia bacterium]|nr:hypothetical protein FACS189426_12270 [Bacteroidia bacterium]GHT27259.1 hypothetical protein FACS189432_03400 [Bacteroidia bacterium]
MKRVVSNLYLCLGIIIMLVSFIYMMLHLDNADSFVSLWIIFVIAGVWLTLGGSFMKFYKGKTIHKGNRGFINL